MIKRNEAKILVPIISAYAEGRILQYKEKEEWRDIEDSEGLSINTIINSFIEELLHDFHTDY